MPLTVMPEFSGPWKVPLTWTLLPVPQAPLAISSSMFCIPMDNLD
jgi:hypothetical protein